MSIVKTFSVGNGDMFYIYHNSENFTVIDCCYDTADNDNMKRNFEEIRYFAEMRNNQVTRFISTHPDEDHILGLSDLDETYMPINNFYCVENKATKKDKTNSFKKYCELRDSPKAYFLRKDFQRKWINVGDDERGASGIHCLWPDINNEEFKKALADTEEGRNFNNISPILTYTIKNGWSFMWMGDMEDDFRNKIESEIDWPHVTVLFAPHHGRKSGIISKSVLDKIKPYVIIIGEAPSEYLTYYKGYNTITQNSAKDIVFDCKNENINIYVGNENYEVRKEFLSNLNVKDSNYGHYIGSIVKSKLF